MARALLCEQNAILFATHRRRSMTDKQQNREDQRARDRSIHRESRALLPVCVLCAETALDCRCVSCDECGDMCALSAPSAPASSSERRVHLVWFECVECERVYCGTCALWRCVKAQCTQCRQDARQWCIECASDAFVRCGVCQQQHCALHECVLGQS